MDALHLIVLECHIVLSVFDAYIRSSVSQWRDFKCTGRCKVFVELENWSHEVQIKNMFHDSDFVDVSFLKKRMLMCHMCWHWVIFSTLTGTVQWLLSSLCLDNSIPTEPKSNNCETKLLILFLLCSNMQSNTFQSHLMSLSFLKSAVTQSRSQYIDIVKKHLVSSLLGRQQGELYDKKQTKVLIVNTQLSSSEGITLSSCSNTRATLDTSLT